MRSSYLTGFVKFNSAAPVDKQCEIIQNLILYSLTSASLLLVNKLLMHYIPLPAFMSLIEFLFCVLFVIFLAWTGLIEKGDISNEKLKIFSLYVIGFTIGIYSNMKALQASTVETIIIFRACTPLCVSFLDYFFLGREFPSMRSLSSMTLVVVGAYTYFIYDKEFSFESFGVGAYFWGIVYATSLCFQMTYGKMIVETVKMKSVWEQVYYTKLLSIIPMTLIFLMSEELSTLSEFELEKPLPGIMCCLLSCVGGVTIGWAGWKVRQLVSAASYTLVGVTNKILTVIANLLIWDQHASSGGIVGLAICILGSAMYEQSPKRSEHAQDEEKHVSEAESFLEEGTVRKGVLQLTTYRKAVVSPKMAGI